MNDSRRSSLKALLGCMLSPDRTAELMDTLSAVSSPLPAILENINRQNRASSLPANVRLLLSMVPELYQLCSMERFGEHPLLDTLGKAGEYARLQYVNIQYESICLMCLDESFRLRQCLVSGPGGLREIRFYPRRLYQEAVSCGARAVILCHNHPSDWAFFSEDDVSATRELLTLFTQAHMPLLDHLLIAGAHVNSMRSRAFLPDADWMACGKGMPTLAQWRRDLGPLSQERFNNATLNR